MDALGHVNNAKFFDYFQEARIEWLASLKFELDQATGPVVVHTQCTYLKPIVYPASLVLTSSILEIGRTSFRIGHELFQGTQLMAKGDCKIVWVDYQLNKSIPVPEKLLNVLKNNFIG